MLRTIPFQNCLSGRILILCFQPDEEWNEIENEIPDYKKWQYVNSQFKLQSSQQCLTAENDLVTMKPCDLNSPDQQWLFQHEIIGSPTTLLDLKKPNPTLIHNSNNNTNQKANHPNQTNTTTLQDKLDSLQQINSIQNTTSSSNPNEFYTQPSIHLDPRFILKNVALIKEQMKNFGFNKTGFDEYVNQLVADYNNTPFLHTHNSTQSTPTTTATTTTTTKTIPPISTNKSNNSFAISENKTNQENPIIQPEFLQNNQLTTQDLEDLASEHKQYTKDVFLDNQKLLANELKQLYCATIDLQRQQALLLAQSNGLIAARSLDLNVCDRIESIGMSLSLQTCKSERVKITAQETRCGYQPIYIDHQNNSFTIGKDGYSLVPFKECFHTGQFINLNEKTYIYQNKSWVREYSKTHITTLKIMKKLQDLPVNELDFATRHHLSYDNQAMEQLNIMSELMSAVQENNGNSISDIIMDVQAKSNVYQFGNWMTYTKYGLLALASIVILIIISKIVLILKNTCKICSPKKKSSRQPRKTSRQHHKKSEESEDSTPMLQPKQKQTKIRTTKMLKSIEPSAPTKSSNSSIVTIEHDHSDTIFIKNKGLFWKDMCPINPKE